MLVCLFNQGPWAHRTMILRALKGLESCISICTVDYLMGAKGWEFKDPEPHGFSHLSQIYFKANPEYSARFTVPVLWDSLKETIVNNESSEIIRMLNSSFNDFATYPNLDLYKVEFRSEIDDINDWVYNKINNGVYKSGFATVQSVYEENCKELFIALDRVEQILMENKSIGKDFLVGDSLSEADIRLWTTIIRFDAVYHGHFKCNLKTIKDGYPVISEWAKMIYKIPGIAATVNMEHVKKHYYMSHIQINPTQVVPLSNGFLI